MVYNVFVKILGIIEDSIDLIMEVIMRKTKIVCTIGPACNNKETLLEMINAGMNVARINMSHGAYDDLENTFNVLKEAIAESGKIVSILLDTKGPK